MPTYRIQTVIDDMTPAMCLRSHGMILREGNAFVHATGDPNNPCRCWLERIDKSEPAPARRSENLMRGRDSPYSRSLLYQSVIFL